MDGKQHKQHHASRTGVKAEKKKGKQKEKQHGFNEKVRHLNTASVLYLYPIGICSSIRKKSG